MNAVFMNAYAYLSLPHLIHVDPMLIPPYKLLCSSQLVVETRPLVTLQSRIHSIFSS